MSVSHSHIFLQKLPLNRIFIAVLALWICQDPGSGLASSITVHIGPPAVGSGGSNPLSIPPLNPLDYEVIYVTDGLIETNIGITPGILVGQRSYFGNGDFYVGLGGGLVIDFNGSGPGIYSSVGLEAGDTIKFNGEFKHAIGYGFGDGVVLNPYAIRLGLTYEL